MIEINEDVIEEAEQRSGNLFAEELVELIERHHPHAKPGIERETVASYAAALADGAAEDFERGTFDDAVEARLTDAETWQGEDVLYVLDGGRVSAFPARWHEALSGSTAIREYVRFLREDTAYLDFESGASGSGIPESILLDIVAVVGQTDRKAVKARVEDLRESGEIVEDADQHPDARVRLAEHAEDLQNSGFFLDHDQ